MTIETRPNNTEQRGFAWGVKELEEREEGLKRIGFSLFFDRVLKLPTIASQPSKNWMDYLESEINFVNIIPEEMNIFLTAEQRKKLDIIHDVLDFWVPMGLAVFNIRDDTHDRHKGIYRHSAEVVVQSLYGEAFRKRLVLHLSHGYTDNSMGHWENSRSISYTSFGKDLGRRSDLKLLLAANSVAELYSEKLVLPNPR